MRIDWTGQPVTIRPATTDDLTVLVDLLEEASGWLHEHGITEQWPLHFEPSWLEPNVAAGLTWLASVEDKPAGTMTLTWTDPIWTDLGPVEVGGYVHKFTVRRWAGGLGRVLLDWAAAQIREQGRDRLRLDCVAVNPQLNAYYRRLDFTFRGAVRSTGPRASWHNRYEKVVALTSEDVLEGPGSNAGGSGKDQR